MAFLPQSLGTIGSKIGNFVSNQLKKIPKPSVQQGIDAGFVKPPLFTDTKKQNTTVKAPAMAKTSDGTEVPLMGVTNAQIDAARAKATQKSNIVPPSQPTPSISAPPATTNTASPVFKGEGDSLFFKSGGSFRKITNPDQLQTLAKAGRIQVGTPYQALPSGANIAGTQSSSPTPPQTNTPTASPVSPRPFQATQKTITQPTQTSSSRPATPDAVTRLREAILAQIAPSAEENAIAEELADVIGKSNENIANLEGQGRGITLDLVRGQQGAIARQAESRAQTLEQRLATREATRRANLQAAQTLLGFEQENEADRRAQEQVKGEQLQGLALTAAQRGASPEEIQGILASPTFASGLAVASPFLQANEAQDLIKLSEGDTLVDPNTGQVVAAIPKSSGSGMFGEFDDLLSVKDAEALGVPFGTTKGEAFGMQPTSVTAEQTQQMAQISEALTSAEALLNHPGLEAATGTFRGFALIPGSDGANFKANLETFVSQNVLPKLELLKGSMSDNDIKFIKQSAGALQRNQSEAQFKENLQGIVNTLGHGLNKTQLPNDQLRNEYEVLRIEYPDATPDELAETFASTVSSFNNALSNTAVKGLTNGRTVLSSMGRGTVTGINGSSAWKHGLDFVLDGGKGAPVPSPVSGQVVFAGSNAGFGNQVKIRTARGNTLWLSHLDNINLRPGMMVTKGQLVGTQGNTGTVLGGKGERLTASQIRAGRGTHLDLTIERPDGSYFSPQEVSVLLGDQRTRLA